MTREEAIAKAEALVDKLERQLDEYFLVGNKKHTAVEKSFIGGYSEDDQRKFLKENDYYHNGVIVYGRFD